MNKWFLDLPVWAELDNYIYFGLAVALIYFLPLENKVEFVGIIVGALVMKAKK